MADKATPAERGLITALAARYADPASGHLVHMHSHIDVRTGRWAQAAEQNRQASRVDAAYRKISPEAATVDARFKKAWAHADTNLTTTCLCVAAK